MEVADSNSASRSMENTRINYLNKANAVLTEIFYERVRQYDKWGVQNHIDGTGPETVPEDYADRMKAVVDSSAAAGTLTFHQILMEEVAEALSEDDPKALRAELIQVSAVAAAWIQKIDRDLDRQRD